MAKEEFKVGSVALQTEEDTKSTKKKMKKKLLEETNTSMESNKKSGLDNEKKGKKKRKKETPVDQDEIMNPVAENGESNEDEKLLNKNTVAEDGKELDGINLIEKENEILNEETVARTKKKKERVSKDAAKTDRRGVCYLSRIPPHMDHVNLRHILSQYGEIQRIYLAPEGGANKHRVQRKKGVKSQDQDFSEGWVEFTNKSVAKRVANLLNGEQMGGRKRSKFYYDLWNIKYLSKFKWDDLTEEIAYKSAIREQKLALELSAAKRERDFYLSKVEKSHALNSIQERLKKKQKVQLASEGEQAPKIIRQFPQTKPLADDKADERRSKLSKDILASVFGDS